MLIWLHPHVDEFNVKTRAKRPNLWPPCISNTFNEFLNILTNDLYNKLLPCQNFNYKIEAMSRSTSPFEIPYKLNQFFLKLKKYINNLVEQSHMKPTKSPYGTIMLFVNKNTSYAYTLIIVP